MTKSCKMRLISILVFFALTKYGLSAPDSSKSEYTQGSASLINILSNMLQTHSGVDHEWMDFANNNYEAANWNPYGSSNLQPQEQPEENKDDNLFGVDLNPFKENDSEEDGSNELYPLLQNYPYNRTPFKEDYNPDDGNLRNPTSQSFVEDYMFGPNRESVELDWNEAIPSRGAMEIEEMISRNFFMAPPKMDTLPLYFNDLTPATRWWRPPFTPPFTSPKPVPNPYNTFFNRGPRFDILHCSPDTAQRDVNKQVPDERERKKNPEDEYVVLLIRKDHVLRKPNDHNPRRNQTKVPQEDLGSPPNNASDIDLCETTKDTEVEDVPCSTTDGISTTDSLSSDCDTTEGPSVSTSPSPNLTTESSTEGELVGSPPNTTDTTCTESPSTEGTNTSTESSTVSNVSTESSDSTTSNSTERSFSSTTPCPVTTSAPITSNTMESSEDLTTTEANVDVGSPRTTTSTTASTTTAASTSTAADTSTTADTSTIADTWTTTSTSTTTSTISPEPDTSPINDNTTEPNTSVAGIESSTADRSTVPNKTTESSIPSHYTTGNVTDGRGD